MQHIDAGLERLVIAYLDKRGSVLPRAEFFAFADNMDIFNYNDAKHDVQIRTDL